MKRMHKTLVDGKKWKIDLLTLTAEDSKGNTTSLLARKMHEDPFISFLRQYLQAWEPIFMKKLPMLNRSPGRELLRDVLLFQAVNFYNTSLEG